MPNRCLKWPPGSRAPHGARRWLLIIVLGVAIQVPLFAAFFAQTGDQNRIEPRKKRTVALTGRMLRLRKKEKPEPVEELPEDAQIVEVPPVEEPTEKIKVKTRHVADRKVRVRKETRSRRRGKTKPHARVGHIPSKAKSVVRGKRSKSTKPTATPKGAKRLALVQPRQKLPKAKRGAKARKSLLFRGAKSRLLLPATSTRNAIANVQALDGGGRSDDHLPKVEEGRRTVLNADKYRFADFFYRLKDAVRRHWHPSRVYRQRDPTGRVYGVKDRHTVLRISLDAKGKVLKVKVRKRCGLAFLDAEAVRAVRKAGPFRNPPEKLVKKGRVNFDFGFYFEISSGRHRFRWRRL